jgi:hypothetical protein
MDNSITQAMDIIFLIFPQKTVQELKDKYGLDMPVKRSIESNWIVLDFGKGRIFKNPMGRIWNAIKDIAEGETTARYLESIKKLMEKYDFPIEYAGYYKDPETGVVKSYQTGKSA